MQANSPPLFVRGPSPLVRLLFFGTFAIVLMVFDARFGYMGPLRQGLLWLSYPLQRIAGAPADLFHSVSGFLVNQTRLQQDNASLREDKLRAARDLLVLEAIRADNERLRALLGARERANPGAVVAQILYTGRDPFTRKVIIDKGSQAAVAPGQPVIDADGLIGQVTRVHPLVAEVTAAVPQLGAGSPTLKGSSVFLPCLTLTFLRAVAFGSGDGSTMELRYMAMNAEIVVGDELTTSGIDGVFPAGLPVARVTHIDRDSAVQFARVLCAPKGGPGKGAELLVLTTAQTAPAAYPEEAAPVRSARARGARNARRAPEATSP